MRNRLVIPLLLICMFDGCDKTDKNSQGQQSPQKQSTAGTVTPEDEAKRLKDWTTHYLAAFQSRNPSDVIKTWTAMGFVKEVDVGTGRAVVDGYGWAILKHSDMANKSVAAREKAIYWLYMYMWLEASSKGLADKDVDDPGTWRVIVFRNDTGESVSSAHGSNSITIFR